MMISTRGRYALRVMIDLAENTENKYIPMKEVAERQGLSLKYLERILPALVKNGFVEGVQGKSGGYKLTKKRIFKMAPIHHHFELCGWSETRVVAVFSIVTAILCLVAYLGL